MKRVLLPLAAFALMMVFPFSDLTAQSKNKIKIDIKVTENGETTRETKEIDLGDLEGLEDLFEHLEILKDIEINADDERSQSSAYRAIQTGNAPFTSIPNRPSSTAHFRPTW